MKLDRQRHSSARLPTSIRQGRRPGAGKPAANVALWRPVDLPAGRLPCQTRDLNWRLPSQLREWRLRLHTQLSPAGTLTTSPRQASGSGEVVQRAQRVLPAHIGNSLVGLPLEVSYTAGAAPVPSPLIEAAASNLTSSTCS